MLVDCRHSPLRLYREKWSHFVSVFFLPRCWEAESIWVRIWNGRLKYFSRFSSVRLRITHTEKAKQLQLVGVNIACKCFTHIWVANHLTQLHTCTFNCLFSVKHPLLEMLISDALRWFGSVIPQQSQINVFCWVLQNHQSKTLVAAGWPTYLIDSRNSSLKTPLLSAQVYWHRIATTKATLWWEYKFGKKKTKNTTAFMPHYLKLLFVRLSALRWRPAAQWNAIPPGLWSVCCVSTWAD